MNNITFRINNNTSGFPKKLFKFVGLNKEVNKNKIDENKIGALLNELIWFSKLENFNDVYEGYNLVYDE